MSDAPPRRVQPRLDLPEADFVALKILAAERATPLRDLLAETVTTWLEGGAPPVDLPTLVEPIVRTHVALPEPVHRRLKVRAAAERTTIQALVRSALAPLLAAGAPPACRVIVVVNPQAGAGRTALTFGLGRALAAAGQRTLLVDLDPQADLTRAAGLEPAQLGATIADLLAPETDQPPRLVDLLRPLGERLTLLPAGPALARAELTLLLAGGRERTLAEALRPALADLDLVLIDCPPSLGLLTLLALVAADQALVPVGPDGADPRELGGLVAAIERLRTSRRAPRLTLASVVVTAGSGKAAALAAMVEALAGERGRSLPVLGAAPLVEVAEATRPSEPPWSTLVDIRTADRDFAVIAEQLLAGTAPPTGSGQPTP